MRSVLVVLSGAALLASPLSAQEAEFPQRTRPPEVANNQIAAESEELAGRMADAQRERIEIERQRDAVIESRRRLEERYRPLSAEGGTVAMPDSVRRQIESLRAEEQQLADSLAGASVRVESLQVAARRLELVLMNSERAPTVADPNLGAFTDIQAGFTTDQAYATVTAVEMVIRPPFLGRVNVKATFSQAVAQGDDDTPDVTSSEKSKRETRVLQLIHNGGVASVRLFRSFRYDIDDDRGRMKTSATVFGTFGYQEFDLADGDEEQRFSSSGAVDGLVLFPGTGLVNEILGDLFIGGQAGLVHVAGGSIIEGGDRESLPYARIGGGLRQDNGSGGHDVALGFWYTWVHDDFEDYAPRFFVTLKADTFR